MFHLRAGDGTQYISTKPFVFPAFAEYPQSGVPTSLDGVRDTGPSIRAFLPINLEADRDRTMNYSGAAAVVDARVVCMRPVLTNLSISGNGYSYYFLEGRFRTDMSAIKLKN